MQDPEKVVIALDRQMSSNMRAMTRGALLEKCMHAPKRSMKITNGKKNSIISFIVRLMPRKKLCTGTHITDSMKGVANITKRRKSGILPDFTVEVLIKNNRFKAFFCINFHA
jgi:hypothetical protein